MKGSADLINKTAPVKQAGVTLIVCMIILVVITILGVGSIQNTMLEEKMAGNMKNRNEAFQAAESALRDAEDYIDDLVTKGDFDGSGALLGPDDDEPDYFVSGTWSAASSAKASVDLGSSKTTPRYIIKHVADQGADENSNLVIKSYGEQAAGSTVSVFKITARGTGGDDNAQVVLQTFYGKRF